MYEHEHGGVKLSNVQFFFQHLPKKNLSFAAGLPVDLKRRLKSLARKKVLDKYC